MESQRIAKASPAIAMCITCPNRLALKRNILSIPRGFLALTLGSFYEELDTKKAKTARIL